MNKVQTFTLVNKVNLPEKYSHLYNKAIHRGSPGVSNKVDIFSLVPI